MRKSARTILLLVTFLVSVILGLPVLAEESETAAMAEADAHYGVQPGDILQVSVWKEADLQNQVLVLPDGTISFPLVGSIPVAGMSIPQIRTEISSRLARYIPDPVVTVVVVEIRGNQAFVIGKVNRPGAFPLSSYLDVVQILSLAGGMSPYAAVNKIKILRRIDGNVEAIEFKYGDVEKGRNLGQNIILQSGDVVVVP